MAKYHFKAINDAGKIREGVLTGPSRAVVRKQLARMRLKVLTLKLDQASLANGEDGSKKILGSFIYRDGNGDIQISSGPRRPTTKHIIVFTKQLSTMLSSGVPLIQGLNILGGQQPSLVFSQALKKIRLTVENGATLSEAMSAFPKIFDPLYLAMVQAGEASGNLDSILSKLVVYIEKSAKIRSQVKSAMMYPLIVITVAIAVIAGLLLFVVPTFANQYADSGRELPGLTQFVIDASGFLANNVLNFAGAMAALMIAGSSYAKTKKGRRHLDGLLLKIPGIGPLLKKIAVGRFCSTMSSMLTSGVNLLQALGICAASAGNTVIEDFIRNVQLALEQGAKLSEPLGAGTLFPEMVVSMVTVGEETGALDEMLAKVSQFYEEEVDIAVQTMLSMIEPILIVGIGGIVGFIVVAMYLPVFDMAGGVSG